MKEKVCENCTNLYDVKRTIAMSLIPQGKTLKHIEESGILASDEERNNNISKAKKILDKYYKKYLNDNLKDAHLDGVEEYANIYMSEKYDKKRKDLDLLEDKMREQVSAILQSGQAYKSDSLFKSQIFNLAKKELPLTSEEVAVLNSFNGFYSYFSKFYVHRKELFSSGKKASTIAFRIVNQNLPKFIDNYRFSTEAFNKINSVDLKSYEDEIKVDLSGLTFKGLFNLSGYDHVLTQAGIDIYNLAVGRMNMAINQYNQNIPKESTERKIGLLKPLYKQLLADHTANSFTPTDGAFTNDQAVLDAVYACIVENNNNISNLDETLRSLDQCDLYHVYLKNGKELSAIINAAYGSWDILRKAMFAKYDREHGQEGKPHKPSYENKRKKWFNSTPSFSIGEIEDVVKDLYGSEFVPIHYYFSHIGLRDCIKKYEATSAECLNLCQKPYPTDRKLGKDNRAVAIIKDYLECALDIRRYISPLLGAGKETDKDPIYSTLEPLMDEYSAVVGLHSKVQSYITKKPYSTEKIKLNLNTANLLGGWDLNMEKSYKGTILRKAGKYYLAIMAPGNKKVFENATSSSGDYYEKMEYKQMGKATKAFGKIVYAKKNESLFNVPDEILRIKAAGTYTKDEKHSSSFNIEDMRKMIDFYKHCLTLYPSWQLYNFNLSDTNSYQNIKEFYDEVTRQSFSIKFRDVDTKYIDDAVESGSLYLFQIYCKDFSGHSKGKKNLHTMYFENLFSEENAVAHTYKLNGGANLFYRKKSIEEKDIVTHPANEPVANKNPLNAGSKMFPYTLVKDKRFTVDQFTLHMTILCNSAVEGANGYINKDVNSLIKKGAPSHVIGVNRGERNLLYIVVSDMDGNIVLQKSLNKIENEYNGVKHVTDYRELLDRREKERMKARKSWAIQENIKDIKAGYLSQVINILTRMMVEYNAAIVIEDLDTSFTNKREAIEKGIYAQFEKKLIEKLNYLVFKDFDAHEPGGVFNALQLTGKFESFEKIGKQSGLLFRLPCRKITEIDPTTGFISRLDGLAKYKNLELAKDFWKKFDSISYNEAEDHFEFAMDYKNFVSYATEQKTAWTICTYGERVLVTVSGDNVQREFVDLTRSIKKLMDKAGVLYKTGDLKKAIIDCDEKYFHEELLKLFKLTVQMRNYAEDYDFIISPVKNENGEFFDSRLADESLPCCIDANAAYSLARKGIMVMEQIKTSEDEKFAFDLTNETWLNRVQA